VSKFFSTKKSIGTLSEVNVIPLVDIVFTLLIIFMIIAPMIHKGIEVQVPDSTVGETMPEHDFHMVSLTQEGALWFDNQEVTLETLPGYLHNMPADTPVYVQSDKHVPYGQVVDVITAIKEQGIRRVGLVTTPANTNRSNREEGQQQ
jgi:biopolymer transport protein TolR